MDDRIRGELEKMEEARLTSEDVDFLAILKAFMAEVDGTAGSADDWSARSELRTST